MSLVVWGVALNDSCQSSLGTTLKGHLDMSVTDRLDIVWRGLRSSYKKVLAERKWGLKKKSEEIRYSFSNPCSLEQMNLLLRYELCVSEANGWMGDGHCCDLTSVTQNHSIVLLRPGQIETLSSPQIFCNLISFPSHPSYSLTLKANVISTAMPEAERDWNNLTLVTSIPAASCQQWEVADGCCCPVLGGGPFSASRGQGLAQDPAPTTGPLLLESLKAAPWLLVQVCLRGMPPK